MIRWSKRARQLHDELASIAEVDPGWWLIAGAAAAAEPFGARHDEYLLGDAEVGADTFIGWRAPLPALHDPVADAIVRARAARTALRELDGQLHDQPLAVTVRRADRSYREPSRLDAVAFAAGDRCVVAGLDDPDLADRVAALVAGHTPRPWHGEAPFACVSIGDDPIATARHGHRRAWTAAGGPWLGLGRTGDLATVSTCHMILDGYGHARIAGRVAELTAHAHVPHGTRSLTSGALALAPIAMPSAVPALAPVPAAIPLGIAWRELPCPAPRALPLGYALGVTLHRLAGKREARFSPTFQIPIAPGHRDDPERRRRRVAPAVMSLRFEDGRPEPYPMFAARAREILAREAAKEGLLSALLAAARAVPLSLARKRKAISSTRPRWLDRLAEVLGGRAQLGCIGVETPVPPSCGVSSPPCLATAADPFGSCVITVIDDGAHAAITACGSGQLAGTESSAAALLDELLANQFKSK